MININLTSRQKRILVMLNAKQGVYSGKELSSAIGISDRTLRTDVKAINAALTQYGISIQAEHSRGYLLCVKNRQTFLELFSEVDTYQTKDDRIRVLILRLLREEDWCNLGVLEDEMYVSHATLEKDLKSMRKMVSFQYPFLKVERKDNLIRLENDEKKKRSLFIRFYVESWDYDSREGILLQQEGINDAQLREIQRILNQKLTESQIYLDDYAFIYLLMTIVVMYLRNQKGYCLTGDAETGEDAPFDFKLPMSRESLDRDVEAIMNELESRCHIHFTRAEADYFAEIKQQLVFLCEKNTQRDFIFLSRTDEKSRRIVEELRENLFVQYGIDFSDDDTFYVGLTRHIQGLRTGMISRVAQNPVLGEELRRKYPFLGDVVHYMTRFIEERCEMKLGKAEEDFLLPSVILAEETLYQKRRGHGIPTAVISHFDDNTTMCLMNLLKQHYGQVLDLYGPFTVHERELIDTDNTMLILSTVRASALYDSFRLPVLKVSPLLDSYDQMGIDLYLFSLKSRYLYQVPKKQMVEYFPEELCYRYSEKNNILPLLAEIKDRLEKQMHLKPLAKIDLEHDYYCVLPNGFLFTYQINDALPQSVASLVDLGKETSCKYARNIRTILYLQMPMTERATLGWFYYLAMALAQYPDELKDFFEGKSLEDLTINISREIQ